MATPTLDPEQLAFAVPSAADGYKPGQRVWVHRLGRWRPGVVLQASAKAVTVRYRPNDGWGTGVDTVTGQLVLDRDDDDPYLDLLSPNRAPAESIAD